MFSAPEIQHKSVCSLASDMFSLGMLMVATFNGGQSLIQANHSTNLYFKQAGVVSYPKRRVYCEEVHIQLSIQITRGLINFLTLSLFERYAIYPTMNATYILRFSGLSILFISSQPTLLNPNIKLTPN